MPKTVLRHRYSKICAALIAADCLVFGLVNPVQANAIWLITGYILVGVTLFALAAALAQTVKTYGERAYRVAWRLLRYATVAAIIVLGLQSIGQLTTKDVVTLTPLLFIAYWYFGYNKRPAAELVNK